MWPRWPRTAVISSAYAIRASRFGVTARRSGYCFSGGARSTTVTTDRGGGLSQKGPFSHAVLASALGRAFATRRTLAALDGDELSRESVATCVYILQCSDSRFYSAASSTSDMRAGPSRRVREEQRIAASQSLRMLLA